MQPSQKFLECINPCRLGWRGNHEISRKTPRGANIRTRKTMAELGAGASEEDASQGQSRERTVVKVDPEDYELQGKDHTSVKVICLGDSAVGKSK